MARQVLT